ncbi:MAG TPA: PQQ-dependent dehydrogenase, methanol/ethanol family [Balneolaceae bacterium]|nr:PQQ-dependent dehydrogenase, methanol/ethanol family [Balneolaceae bacterium]|tara:strand:+ start:68264 stop:70327 length:2064 start_codon:yes stop_codon:yes gene_type:complete
MRTNILFLFFAFSVLIISNCSKSADNELIYADGSDGNWLLHGLNYSENRYSPLAQINEENIDQLGLDWQLDLGMKRGIEATPIIKDGVMYFTGPWSVVFAVDLRSHEIIWKYDPEVPKSFGEKGCCDVVNRGVALYNGQLYFGTFDGRLIALEAESGKLLWEVLTVDQSKPYTITGAPRVVNGKVLIGNGGAELGVRGYFTAYDAYTGDEIWRFYTVPGNPDEPFENEAMEKAAETWTGTWWEYGGGGTVWDAMAYDPELNLLYVGTGNGSPWNWKKRSPEGGDNLYLSSILALDPDTGELKWYYQTTPGDAWDFTATQHMILTELEIDDEPRKVIMQAPKNGFFYVLDRETGELISAEKFVYVNWADSIDLETGRPVERPHVRYVEANFQMAPDYNGGHNWQPMAYNPDLGYVFIPARETTSMYGQDSLWKFNKVGFGTGNGWNLATGTLYGKPTITDDKATIQGKLMAWDPVKQEAAWVVEQNNIWNGGLLTTASGLVFQGTADGKITAYRGSTGDLIWEADLQTGILSSPVTYLVDGVQYLTVITGWGGGYGMKNKHTNAVLPGTVYTFRIGGSADLPKVQPKYERALISPKWDLDLSKVSHGETTYWKYCGTCHVVAETGGGVAPDLGYSPMVGTPAFTSVVLDGALLINGMPNFGDRLNKDDAEAIQHYIINKVRTIQTAGK